jgi:hypothetical protein
MLISTAIFPERLIVAVFTVLVVITVLILGVWERRQTLGGLQWSGFIDGCFPISYLIG